MKPAAKMLFNNKLLRVLTIILLALPTVFTVIVCTSEPYPISIELFLYMFLILYFILYMFISYEFISQTKAVMLLECVDATYRGETYLLRCEVLLLTSFAALQSIFLIISEYIFGIIAGNLTLKYAVYIAVSIFLNYFLVCLAGILFGAFSALKLKRIPAYILMIFFAVMTSGIIDIWWEGLYGNNYIDVTPITDLFVLTVPSSTWAPNAAIGYSVLPYRFATLLFWILLSVFGIILSLHAVKRKQVKATVSVMLSAVFLVLYLMPSSKSVLGTHTVHTPGNEEAMYYSRYAEKVVSEAPDFSITDMAMELSTNLQLSAAVTMQVDKTDLDTYKFTLYHTYKVKNVLINREEAEYDRDADYIEIKNPGQEQVESLEIEYEGYSDKFYSNIQGAILPGYFPYYPLAGYYDIYDKENNCFVYSYGAKNINFDINVKSPNKFHSNLEEVEKNHFAGVAKTVSLVSGFYNEEEYNGVRIIYTYTYPETLDVLKEHIDDFKNSSIYKNMYEGELETLILAPSINLISFENCYFNSGYVFTIQDTLENRFEEQIMGPEKLKLYNTIYDYLYDYGWYKEMAKSRDFYEAFEECVKSLDNEKFFNMCDEYMYDTEDTRTVEEFLENILEAENA